MKEQKSQNRFWIVFNIICLVLLLVFFYLGKFRDWPLILSIVEILFIVLFMISLYFAFIKTKFWKLVHSKSENLDEREVSVVLNGLKYSYSIFTIIIIVVIYISALLDLQFLDVIFAGGLLYLAHILPAAVVGWNEKIV